MRTGTNDKALIQQECYKAYQHLDAVKAIVTFALYQAENAEPEEFAKLQLQWEAMLRLLKTELEVISEHNSEAGYLAATCTPTEETTH